MSGDEPSIRPGAAENPPRVLLLCQGLDLAGGVERFVCTLANHLASQGFATALGSVDTLRGAVAYPLDPAVRLLTGRSASSRRVPSVHRRAGAIRAWALLRDQWRIGRALAGLIRAERPDVVVLNGLTTACSVLLLHPGCARRTICCDHNHFGARSRPWRWLRRRLYPRVAALVSLTEADAPRFRALNPRTEVIANASSLGLQAAPGEVQSFQAPPGEAPSQGLPPLVLAIGRCVEQKGLDLLLQAWQQLRQRPSPPPCRLRIVGDGPLREALMAEGRRLGIEGSVEWSPPTRDIERHYREAAVFVLPSRYEGLPLALLEAQAMGLPAVAFDCPTGPAEVIDSGTGSSGTGLVVPAGDVAALAEALAVLLAQPALRERMGRAARQRSREHFGLARHLDRWTALIRVVATLGASWEAAHGAAEGRHA